MAPISSWTYQDQINALIEQRQTINRTLAALEIERDAAIARETQSTAGSDRADAFNKQRDQLGEAQTGRKNPFTA